MFHQVSVLFAYKPDKGPRDAALKWTTSFYKRAMPGIEICIGEDSSRNFNRSKALNRAAKQSKGKILVIADLDVFYDPAILKQSIKLLKKHAWVVPFSQVINLSEKNTKRIYESKAAWPLQAKIQHAKVREYSKWTGKLNIVPREAFKKVGGLDERFSGWGCEDTAFALALNAICGPYKRLDHSIYHLWHPRVGPKGNPNFDNNMKLLERYKQADSKESMRRLIGNRK
ncbi:galactosyltransferase-related protein [Paenibacillus hexagrammi]|uniref:Galactosyltransferase-related protein n=1 Tax=Paenibacillus hexagrammi TaxID=2908839 RepID=A0ABY3SE39_9BACL|nr:galactosyltransferase-related protein [Paenibacillus sp. YPD9-1]UJF32102.1 galactosyltransferase-related protein [Paenibacillus sp. YPD9-1]